MIAQSLKGDRQPRAQKESTEGCSNRIQKVFLGQNIVVERDENDKLNSSIVMKSGFSAKHTAVNAVIYGTQLAFHHLR